MIIDIFKIHDKVRLSVAAFTINLGLFVIDFFVSITILSAVKFYLVTNGKMHEKIDVSYYFKGVKEQVEESIKMYVKENITKKMDAYFKKVLGHEDARISIRVTIQKHKGDDERYDGTFLFTLNGKVYQPYKRE